MGKHPKVVVKPPDSRGLREVTVGGIPVGAAWSLRDLRRILRRAGFPRDVDLNDPSIVRWREAGSTTWPHRARRLVTLVVMVAGFLGSMALFAYIGLDDAFNALTFAGRVTGALFVAAGAVEGAAALAALDYWAKRKGRYSGAVSLGGSLIALAVSSLLVFVWHDEMEFPPLVPMIFAVWVWAAWTTALLHKQRAWHEIPSPKGVAIGVALTVAFTGANFVYSAMYQPSAMQPFITTEVKFGVSKIEGSTIHLPVDFRVRNSGKVPVYVLETIFWVRGETAEFTQTERPPEKRKTDAWQSRDTDLYRTPPESKLISTGWWVAPGSWLEPGAEFSTVKIAQMPRSAHFDLVRANANALILRRDRAAMSTGEFAASRSLSFTNDQYGIEGCPEQCNTTTTHFAEVRHNNTITNVTREPRYVTSWMTVNRDGINSSIGAGIGAHNQPADEGERYGLTYQQSVDVATPFAALSNPSLSPSH
ncbi:hypothetical protein ACFQ7O_27255 [Streptomyces sp. NPDC056485]|uniref:hypothetical protein n=1 Tax=Streptomyces sp. NPDC056485 TaxID=3345834 RepID=UPI0036893A98